MNLEKNVRTDLILEKDVQLEESSIIEEYDQIKVMKNQNKENHYTTILFPDITEKENYQKVLKVFTKEIKNYLNIKKNDIILVIGLGNEKSTPDSLGPNVVDHILVTRYLTLFGEIEEGYSNVCSFIPDVMGNTGIETADIIKSIINDTKATKVIVIDALKTNHINRLVKTIQITNQGISPGSGIQNNRAEISKKTMNIDIIAIGVPTVVDIKTIIENYIKEDIIIEDNLMVTPTNIDFLIEKLSYLISDGLNLSLHKNYIRQNNLL